MAKENCWEFKNCGRQVGGAKVGELGVCPAASTESANGYNGGIKGGRICWSLAGTFCGGKVQGTFTDKQASCMGCEFFKKVKTEESSSFALMQK